MNAHATHGDTAAGSGSGAFLHPHRMAMLWINVLGGVAVLGSYAYGIGSHPEPGAALWGGVPEALRPLYTVSMLTATLGYFLFTYFLFFRTDPERTRVAGRFDLRLINFLYLLILVPSALWMPLTFAYVDAPSAGLFAAVRGVLAVTGLGSLGLVVALLRLRPREPRVAWALAVLGSVLFTFQTGVLDALVWTAYFR